MRRRQGWAIPNIHLNPFLFSCIGRLIDVDITEIEMETEISLIFGIEHLAVATKDDAQRKVDEINGYFYGRRGHLKVPCIVIYGKLACWVYFIVIPSAYVNFLSKKVNAPIYAESMFG